MSFVALPQPVRKASGFPVDGLMYYEAPPRKVVEAEPQEEEKRVGDGKPEAFRTGRGKAATT